MARSTWSQRGFGARASRSRLCGDPWLHGGGMRNALLVLMALVGGMSSRPCHAQDAIIPGGAYDQNLWIATDESTQIITGYMDNNRGCRYVLRGRNRLAGDPYRENAIDLEAWPLGKPQQTFNIEAYAQLSDSYQGQITLVMRSGMPPKQCEERTSLDRAYNVSSSSYTAVRVLRSRHPAFHDFVARNGGYVFAPVKPASPPAKDSGVWLERTWGHVHTVPRFVRIAWSAPDGSPQAAYVREGDLYPMPPPAE